MAMSDPKHPDTAVFEQRLNRLKEQAKSLVVCSQSLDPDLRRAAKKIQEAIDDADLDLIRARR